MATRKAPRTRGRGRWVALTTVFFAALIATSTSIGPAFAADKGPDDPGNGNGNGNGKPAEISAPAESKSGGSGNGSGQGADKGSQGQGNGGQGSKGSAQGGSNGTGDQGSTAPTGGTGESGPGNGEAGNGNGQAGGGDGGQKVDGTQSQAPFDKDGEPNKPPTEKYNGPCTRHDDPPGNGTGHDWHRGWGVGHNGVKPLPPDEPGDEGEGDLPSDEGTEPGEEGNDEPFLPFTPPLQPAIIVTVSNTPTAQDPDLPEFLPYTGTEADMLLTVAACAMLLGVALRALGHPRMYAHRRIAR